MNPQSHPRRIVWATRGRRWGFRFLRDGGETDPLPTYDRFIRELDDSPETWGRFGEVVALRFLDPDGRTDEAGRVIPHEVVVFPPEAAEIASFEDGKRLVWAAIWEEFARVWDLPQPPG